MPEWNVEGPPEPLTAKPAASAPRSTTELLSDPTMLGIPGLGATPQGVYDVHKQLQTMGPVGEAASFAVPGSNLDAALMAGSLAIPALKGAGPVGKFIGGTKLGRTVLMTGIGAGEQALEGKSALIGGAIGAGANLIGEGANWLIGHIGTRYLTPWLFSKDGKVLANAIADDLNVPVKTAADLEGAFGRQEESAAVKRMGERLNALKTKIGQSVKGQTFNVPVLAANGNRVFHGNVSFEEADAALESLRKQAYSLDRNPRGTILGSELRKLSYEARQNIADQLNKTRAGLGDAYLTARKKFAATMDLTEIFSDPALYRPDGTLDQSALTSKLMEYAPRFIRNLGRGRAERYLDIARRFGKGAVTDVAATPMRPGISFNPLVGGAHISAHPGRGGQLAGRVPQVMDPKGRPLGAAVTALVSELTTLIGNQVEDDSAGAP